MENTKNKTISKKQELIRFLICGVACALADFLVGYAVTSLLPGSMGVWVTIIAQTCGFAVGVVLNYILSTYWVFTGVDDESKTKTPMFIFLFILLSAGAWALSAGTFIGCKYAILGISNNSIDIDQVSLKELFTFQFWGNATFWLYFLSFCIKTIVGLIWNYITRKKILYKNKNK